jgi:secreted trypsin-like serine protease
LRRTIIRACLGAAAVTAMLLPVAPAGAITPGTPDQLDNDHTGVGMVRFSQPDGRFRCSGTLITSTVVLTAAHCTDHSTDVYVTFDNPGTADPLSNPATLPRYIHGTAFTHPGWTGQLQLNGLKDTGVVILDDPATTDPRWPGIEAYPLPPRTTPAYLDGLNAKGGLKGTPFTLSGYGVFFEKPADGSQKKVAVRDLTRRQTTAGIQNLTSDVIKLQENEKNSQFGGGTCFGDSGGPIFLNGFVVGDTSFGGAQFCTGMGGYQRVDTKVIRDWLDPIVALNP